jgi:hypothetical protein
MELLELSRKEALEQVIAHLEYQRFNYEKLPPEQRKGHIWEAVRVLERDLAQQAKQTQERDVKPVARLVSDRQIRSVVRKVDGPVQGY